MSHFIHFGRKVGAASADLQEIPGYDQDDLGNWNVNVRRKDYSTHLPMQAMRIMAGHESHKALYFIARNRIVPEESLCDTLFPWLKDAKKSINSDQQTALSTLLLYQSLSKIILQDAAEMIIKGKLLLQISHILPNANAASMKNNYAW